MLRAVRAMVASDNWPTYLLLTLFVAAMVLVTFIADRQNARTNRQSIETHFLASKQFGVFVLMLTTFATVYSGYTVVGVPNEAGLNGFSALRWMGGIGAVYTFSILILFPRLRRISIARNYTSPGEFIMDRFQSKPLAVLNTFCLCIPQLLFITVQFHALGSTLNFFTNGELPFNAIVIVSAVLILLFEAFGGLRTVAYTDMVQASVMILTFLCIPIILAIMYHGGFAGMVVNRKDLPCPNDANYVGVGCLNYMNGPPNGEYIAKEFYLRKPSSITAINCVIFLISRASLGINPHTMQRIMAAKHDWQVRTVMMIMPIAGWIAQLPGILIGISYLSNVNSFEYPLNTYPAFQSILVLFQQEGGFREFISYVAMLGSVAAIMSTADSALIGVSNTFVVDIFKHWLTPDLDQKWIVWIGKAISLITVAIAVSWAMHLESQSIRSGEPVSYAILASVQGAILWQSFPVFVFGLYTRISWKSVLSGMSAGIFFQIILMILVFDEENNPFIAMHPLFEKLDPSWSSLVGVFLNLIVCGISHLVFGGDDNANERDVLSIDKISGIMQWVGEPIKRCHGIFVFLPALCALISTFHWIGAIDPDLIEIYGKKDVEQLLYNGYVDDVIGGFPSWAFATIIWYGFVTISAVYGAYLWNTDGIKDDDILLISGQTLQPNETLNCQEPVSYSSTS